MSNNILANNFSIEWVGGIPPTEKDSIAEAAYFYSYLYQGGELLDEWAVTKLLKTIIKAPPIG